MLYILTLLLLAPGDDASTKAQSPPVADSKAATASASPGKEKSAVASEKKEDAASPAKDDAKKDDEKKDSEKEDGKSDERKSASPWDMLNDIMKSGAMGYMIEGGFFMWPILLCGILAAGVIIERYRSLKMLTTDTSALRSRVQELLQQGNVDEALRLCDGEQGPVPAILSTGLRKYLLLQRLDYDPGQIESQVVKSIDDYSIHIVAALERHLPILATISSVAPMLGFLGTVQGMVVSFDDIVRQMGKTNIVEAAAAGIKVSLLTTVLGLVVGIPAFTAFNYFTSVINRFVLEVSESASELIETVTLQLALRKKN